MVSPQQLKNISAVAAETIAISEAAREQALRQQGKLLRTQQATQDYRRQVPIALAAAFNARFSCFWIGQMHDSYNESARQIRGWLDLYAKGILLDKDVFIEALKRRDYVPLVSKHLEILVYEQQNQQGWS